MPCEGSEERLKGRNEVHGTKIGLQTSVRCVQKGADLCAMITVEAIRDLGLT